MKNTADFGFFKICIWKRWEIHVSKILNGKIVLDRIQLTDFNSRLNIEQIRIGRKFKKVMK